MDGCRTIQPFCTGPVRGSRHGRIVPFEDAERPPYRGSTQFAACLSDDLDRTARRRDQLIENLLGTIEDRRTRCDILLVARLGDQRGERAELLAMAARTIRGVLG